MITRLYTKPCPTKLKRDLAWRDLRKEVVWYSLDIRVNKIMPTNVSWTMKNENYKNWRRSSTIYLQGYRAQCLFMTPPRQRSWWGYHLVRPPPVRLWTKSCQLCIFHITCRIHSLFTHLINQFLKVWCILSYFFNSKIWMFTEFTSFWSHYMTLNLNATQELDHGFSKSNFEIAVIKTVHKMQMSSNSSSYCIHVKTYA